jgi:hypothetical protein
MAQTSSPRQKPRTDPPIAWAPQAGPQKALIDCPFTEILFGGARGGGKTDGVLGKWAIKASRHGRGFNAVFFRREMPQQDDLIERAREIYGKLGGAWQESRRMFLMPGGGRIRFRPLENRIDAEKYQGQNLTDAAVEEAGNYEQPDAIDRLFGCLRSSTGVPVQLILTANPGGVGHQWIKQRFIDPAPLGMKMLVRKLPNGREHRYVYIPSKLADNRILLQQDPDYASRLYLVGSVNLVRAWLLGDWSVIEGAYFPEFSGEKHVVAPLELPKWWPRIRAGDWGSAKPFCFLWLAVSDGSLPQFPRGALIVYREWYGWNGKPNVGCKMNAVDVGRKIAEFDQADIKAEAKITDEVLDPAAFAQDGGPSIAERLNNNWRRADNARVAKQGAVGGWDQVRERLQGEEGRPMLYVFSTCTHLIRTLPALQHDSHRAEDVDTDSEDHAADALRYGCMSRPWVRDEPGMPAPRFDTQITVDELIKRARSKRIAQE